MLSHQKKSCCSGSLSFPPRSSQESLAPMASRVAEPISPPGNQLVLPCLLTLPLLGHHHLLLLSRFPPPPAACLEPPAVLPPPAFPPLAACLLSHYPPPAACLTLLRWLPPSAACLDLPAAPLMPSCPPLTACLPLPPHLVKLLRFPQSYQGLLELQCRMSSWQIPQLL